MLLCAKCGMDQSTSEHNTETDCIHALQNELLLLDKQLEQIKESAVSAGTPYIDQNSAINTLPTRIYQGLYELFKENQELKQQLRSAGIHPTQTYD